MASMQGLQSSQRPHRIDHLPPLPLASLHRFELNDYEFPYNVTSLASFAVLMQAEVVWSYYVKTVLSIFYCGFLWE